MASQSAPNCKQENKRKQTNKRKQKSHKHAIFAFFCLISAQFVRIIPGGGGGGGRRKEKDGDARRLG